ncbi:hypothetical protein K443DRAFT_672889 [Laccaria amethystina LaAM-08-1]|uniref:PDZ GRASP-type domain-containing protein n=1 Tax=Laccaria amethystina LaAM-08-1 TaxID=1095629 RepID=A0A0C9X765_9AGAR|nr:hypothetical protein K443DRAFT_672889 [Laccaria amethystina LaAM-08-1]
MGAGQSTSQAHPPKRGLHVLRVTPSSPASQTNIEPFFDFVVGFEGNSLSSEKSVDVAQLEKIVEGHEGRTLNLLVWNAKSQRTRVVAITPSKVWSQSHFDANHIPLSASTQPSLLGLSMRICEPEIATDNVWHVLDVMEGSPAESAGLVPMGDWILGWSGGVLSAENDFYDLVEAHVDKPLRVYVYSHDFDTLREVVLIPNRHWGGEGLLGCVFGFGLLHRIPSQAEERAPGTIPAELYEDKEEYEQQELFVPADIQTEHSPRQLAEWRRQEQEQWNREVLARSIHEHAEETHSKHSLDDHDDHHHHHHGHHTHTMQPQRIQSPRATAATPNQTRTPLSHLVNGSSSSSS